MPTGPADPDAIYIIIGISPSYITGTAAVADYRTVVVTVPIDEVKQHPRLSAVGVSAAATVETAGYATTSVDEIY